MLKIKDNVDLKELEKFGFEYTNEYEQIYNFETNNNSNCILIPYRKIMLRAYEIRVFEDFKADILYDLIQANLVEKVEEE